MKSSLIVTSLAAVSALSAGQLKRLPDGVLLDLGSQHLKVAVYADNIIRVTASAAPDASVRPSIDALPAAQPTPAWSLKSQGDAATLSTAALKVRIDSATGRLTFLDATGREVLAERPGVQRLVPAKVQGEQTFHVQQQWEPHADEAFYGLGQQQKGLVDIKGYDLDLWQHNTNIAIPFLVSSRGYGILWDNTSETRWGDTRPFVPIPPADLVDADGRAGALTGTYFEGAAFNKSVSVRRDAAFDFNIRGKGPDANARINPALPAGELSVRWDGSIVAKEGGDYQFTSYFDGDFKLWIDGKLLMNHYRQEWLPGSELAKVHFDAGTRHSIRMEWVKDQRSTTVRVLWKTPSKTHDTSLWSEVGDGVDYYFVYGPSLDKVVAGYRTVTGRAALMPQWAFGLWQSRERYETAQQSLDVIDEFRKRGIPFDNIVQDWQYWRKDTWGSHEFDRTRFPHPTEWIKEIHARHAHLMISVWGKFYPGTKNFDEMQEHGFLLQKNLEEGAKDFLGYPFTFFDAYNPAARKLFWSQMNTHLFSKGVDAWWMDASEPDLTAQPDLELQKTHISPNFMGTGSRMLLGYPLLIAEAVYDGQRSVKPDQRVFNLTRSGFLGQQRYAAASWSGDITSTWTAMKKQIAAGLGFSISGVPYWTMDIGGFSVPERFIANDGKETNVDEWREMNTRWFEFGTFVPLLRVHGQKPRREMWYFGAPGTPAYDAMLNFDRIRYRMLPYIYSLAGAATQDGGVIMRPLVMDFPEDRVARSLTDQYLFGPELLVNPVTEYKARSREVYLPAAAGGWYDFWTGEALGGGKTIDAPAPYGRIPLMVRAGSILPLGPELQYTGEKPANPITLMVYAGTDGHFSLYEDDGLTYGYEKGAFARIPFEWNEATQTLTIGARAGRFPGMLETRRFDVILVKPGKAVPFSFDPKTDRTVEYTGQPVEVRF